MARTYRALALLLTYPTPDLQALAPEALAMIETEALVPKTIRQALRRLVAEITGGDIYDLQEAYTELFDRTRSLSLNLYEHVHGESRDRGEAMVALAELYRPHALHRQSFRSNEHGRRLARRKCPPREPASARSVPCLQGAERAAA